MLFKNINFILVRPKDALKNEAPHLDLHKKVKSDSKDALPIS